MTQAQRRLLLIQSLLKENRHIGSWVFRQSRRASVSFAGAAESSCATTRRCRFLLMQDAYLQGETAAKVITDIADLTPIQPGLYLWQGTLPR